MVGKKSGLTGLKSLILLWIFIFVVILFAWLVLTISGEGVRIRSPAAQANFSNSSTMLLNVTFTNASDITIGGIGNINQTTINASFFYNESGVWRFLGNSSTCDITGPEIACWGTINLNITNVSDGVFSINATLYNETANIAIANLSNLTALIRVDKTPPMVFIQNFSRPLFAEGNYSGTNIVLNVSIFEATTTVMTVIFNITNITGEQHNVSYTGALEAGSVAFKNFFNTTAFPDGTYNISVNVNDTVNNRNNTARFTVRFDNTKPIVFNGNISSPVAGTNYTGSNLLLNVSIVDLTSSIDVIYFNITNATGTQNATFTATREGTANAFKTYLNTTGFSDGNYTITVWANDTAGNLNNSARLIDVGFDNTKPIVFNGNVSSPVIETNYSGANNLLLNVSIVDLTSSVGTVYFNITNATGTQNATFTATREGTANAFKTYLNTTGFTSGIYNVTVWANDTAGNLNNSALISNIRLDNTPPIVFTANISRPLFAEGNYSATNLKLNVSVVDSVISINTVYFNITNATGTQNASYTAVLESGGNSYITYLNTSGFSDGNYTITVWANDTLNNNNNSASFKVRFDNTRPIVVDANISRPLFAGGNYTGSNLRLNVSIIDVTSSIDVIYFNVTNATGTQNASFTATREGTANSFVTYLNTTGFADANYTITVFSNDTAGNTNNTARLIDIRFDNTRPIVFSQNISKPLSGTNHTGTIVFNVSLVDALTAIDVIYFNITNGTGTQNTTYTATREGTTTRYSVSVATTGFKDGNYTVTAFVNDTAGNLNSSAATTSVLFDNTVPIVSVSCNPSTVTAGELLTCTCSRSDATSGINTVNFNANPSTSSTGTFTSSCTVSDLAGNSASASTTYRVESGGSGVSGGAGGGGGAATPETKPAEEKSQTVVSISPETPASVTNFGNTNVKEIVIDVKEKAANVKITVAKYDSKPSEVTTKDGKVYSYMQIKPNNVLKDKIEEAKVTFKVDKTWIKNNGLTTDKVEVYKFDGVWNGLGAVYKGDESNNALYEAKMKGFSFFAIGEKAVEQPSVTPTPVQEEVPQVKEIPELAPEEEISNVWIWVIVAVVIVIAILTGFIVWKKRQ